jgi:hypothetical protein
MLMAFSMAEDEALVGSSGRVSDRQVTSNRNGIAELESVSGPARKA